MNLKETLTKSKISNRKKFRQTNFDEIKKLFRKKFKSKKIRFKFKIDLIKFILFYL